MIGGRGHHEVKPPEGDKHGSRKNSIVQMIPGGIAGSMKIEGTRTEGKGTSLAGNNVGNTFNNYYSGLDPNPAKSRSHQVFHQRPMS